jgi:hypothetical protein
LEQLWLLLGGGGAPAGVAGVDRLLGEHGLQQDGPAAGQELECRMEAQRLETPSVKQIAIRLHLGTPKSASVRLLTAGRQKAYDDPAQRSLGI